MGQKLNKHMEGKAVASKDIVDSDEVNESTKPWREVNVKHLPTEEFFQHLKDDIKKFDALKRINILTVGYIRAGKSSFINTINSSLEVKEYVAHCAISGDDPKSITTKLEHYEFDGFPHISLWDTKGIDNDYGLHSKDFMCLLSGYIKPGYVFDNTKPIHEKHMKYNSCASLADRPHVVCFVFDGNTLHGLLKDDRHARNLSEHLDHIKSKGLRYNILLTQMDQVCPFVKKSSSDVYTSEAVKSLVMGMAERLHIEPNIIVPTVNYNSNDTETNMSTNIVALVALRQLLRNANDYITNTLRGRDKR